MKFIVSSTSLLVHLQAISRVINSKNTLPILNCFLFELTDGVLTISASGTETTMITSVEVNESDGNGRFAMIARTLLEAMKEIPEQPVSFQVDPSTYEITLYYMNGQYRVMGQNPDEFPQLPALDSSSSVQIHLPSKMLLDCITHTLFATGDDEMRQIMTGIYVDIDTESITFVGTDGYKLSREKNVTVKGKDRAAFIFPKKPATLLKSLLTKDETLISIEFDSRNAVFVLPDYRMICRLVEGRYPKYNSVIPQNNPYKITIDRTSLLGALRRVSICSSQSVNLVKLTLQQGQLTVSTQDIDFSTSAEERLICQYDGVPMSIGFKVLYLIDILNNIPGNEVVIELADPSRAGVIVPSEQAPETDLLMLVMPITLTD